MRSKGPRESQEDRAGATESPTHILLAVVDGMGGLEGGAEAAQTVQDALLLETNVKLALEKAHQALLEHNKKTHANLEPKEMPGAVGTLVSIDRKSLTAQVGHLGDTRLYLCRGGEVELITTDQVDEANLPTQDFGRTEIEPVVTEIRLRYQDILILASDGAYNVDPYPEDNFKHFLSRFSHRLMTFAKEYELQYQDSFKDNATLLLFRIQPSDVKEERQNIPILNPRTKNALIIVLYIVIAFLVGFWAGANHIEKQLSEQSVSD
ncbi:MAG: protein phosphatase 2C domain-containing protein [Myxococcota bacterium]|nr:protein phosphatase 2C domain-containing protein [Myxococcota bacterium]